MPTHYDDGRIFRIRLDPIHGAEVTLKLTDAELAALKGINPKEVPARSRTAIGLLVEYLYTQSANPVLDRLFGNVEPVTNKTQTSQDAIPNSKRWTQNLHDVYEIIRSTADGLTDEESQDRYAERNKIDRRDIGNRWRPARVALVKIGVVKDTGEKRNVRSGKEAIVWSAVERTWTPPALNETLQKDDIIELITRRDAQDGQN
jgi:hypothetical protein